MEEEMQLVIAGAAWIVGSQWAVEAHNRIWRDVKEAIRKTKEEYRKGQR
jgi:hypothetical protein